MPKVYRFLNSDQQLAISWLSRLWRTIIISVGTAHPTYLPGIRIGWARCTVLYRFVPLCTVSCCFLRFFYLFDEKFTFPFCHNRRLKAIMAHLYRFVPLCTGFSIVIITLSVMPFICGELIAPTYLARIGAICAKMGNFFGG